MDDLVIIVKTKLEADEAQARQEISSLEKKFTGDNAVKIKSKIEIDQKASQQSVKNAIPSLSQAVSTKPIKVALDINKSESLKNIRAGIKDIQNKIKNNKLKIDLDVGNVSGSARAGSASSKNSSVPGVRYGNIKGSKKYADALRAHVDNYTKAFKDKGATLSDVNISYDPIKKLHSAVVKYQNEVGQTTSMVFKLKEGWEQVKVVQTGVHKNYQSYNKELERSKKIISDYEIKLANLKSKAFSQKDPIPDEYVGNLNSLISQIESTLKGVGNLISTETSVALEKLFADANNEVAEIRSQIKTATSLRQKDVSSQKLVEANRLDAFIAKMKNAGVYTEEMTQSVAELRAELEQVGNSDGLKKYLNDYDVAFSRFQTLKEEKRSIDQGIDRSYTFDEDSASKYWQGRFSESVQSFDGKNAGLDELNAYFKAQEKEAQLLDDLAKKQEDVRQKQIDAANRLIEASSHEYWQGRFKDSLADMTSTNGTLKEMSDYYEKLEKEAKADVKNEKTWETLDSKKSVASVELGNRINELKELGLYAGKTKDAFDDLARGLKIIGSPDAFSEWRTQLKQAEAELEQFLATAQGKGNTTAKLIDTKQLSQINSLLSNNIISAAQTDGITSLKNELTRLQSAYQEVRNSMRAENLSDEEYMRLAQTLKELDVQLQSAANSAKLFDGSFKSNQNLEKAQEVIEKLRNELENIKVNTSAMQFPELRAEIEKIENALRGVDAVNVSNVQRQFVSLRAEIRSTGATAKSFGAQIKDIFNQLTAYFSVADVVMEIAQAFGKMAEEVKAVNSSMTELKKIQDFTKESQDIFMKNAGQSAKDIGTTMSAYIEGVADYKKLGNSLEDSVALSESANILYRVGDGFNNISEATDATIASLKAYKIANEDVMHVVDALNKVSNETSIETVGLADAITRSASSLAMGGLSFEKSLALIVAGNETVRNASIVGNGLKTMALRIMGAETEYLIMLPRIAICG